MKNKQTAKQEGIIDQIKKTYPSLNLITHDEFARLWHEDDFPTSNESRLYRDVSKKILRSFTDFHYAFMKLPYSYQIKILTGREFAE